MLIEERCQDFVEQLREYEEEISKLENIIRTEKVE